VAGSTDGAVGMATILPWPRPAQRRGGWASGARGGVVVLPGSGKERGKCLAQLVNLVEDRDAGAPQGARVAGPGGLGADQQVAVPVTALVARDVAGQPGPEASVAAHRCTTRGSVNPAASQRLRASPTCLSTQMA
jgi:hypothetical protein